MSDGIDPDELSDEQLRTLAESPLARLSLACSEVIGASEEIRENDLMWDRMVNDVASNSSAISSARTADDVLTTFLEQIEKYGTLAEPDDEDDEEGGKPEDIPPIGDTAQ